MAQTTPLDDIRAAYQRDGYVIPEFRVPDDLLGEMRASLDRLVEENPSRRPEHLVLRWGGRDKARPTDMKFLEYARTPAILDVVEQVIGPDIVCWGAHVFCKPAEQGLEVPWHQDGQYWPIRPLATCTAWIALDDADTGNGCLRVVRGSHRTKTTYHHQHDDRPESALNLRLDEADFDTSEVVDIELEAGQLSLHDAYTIHGSQANTSGRRRAGFTIRYMPATSRYDRSIRKAGGAAAIKQDMSKRPIYLVRGQDRAGNDFECGQDEPFAVGGD